MSYQERIKTRRLQNIRGQVIASQHSIRETIEMLDIMLEESDHHRIRPVLEQALIGCVSFLQGLPTAKAAGKAARAPKVSCEPVSV